MRIMLHDGTLAVCVDALAKAEVEHDFPEQGVPAAPVVLRGSERICGPARSGEALFDYLCMRLGLLLHGVLSQRLALLLLLLWKRVTQPAWAVHCLHPCGRAQEEAIWCVKSMRKGILLLLYEHWLPVRGYVRMR